MDMLWNLIMVAQWEHDEVEKFIVVAWVIWSKRNESRNWGGGGGGGGGAKKLY